MVVLRRSMIIVHRWGWAFDDTKDLSIHLGDKALAEAIKAQGIGVIYLVDAHSKSLVKAISRAGEHKLRQRFRKEANG